MESQKIKNLLNYKDETYSKYQTRKWYIINDRDNGQYDKSIKIDTEVVKLFLCDYADAYISVTGDITVDGGNVNTKVAFKNFHPFTKSQIHLNNEHVEESDNLDIIMNMYNLIEYSDKYEDSTASLYHFKRQEPLENNVDLTLVSSSFSYKSGLLGDATEENGNAIWKNAQIIVPLKYISSFLTSLELPLINTKLYIQLNYTKKFVISSGRGAADVDESIFKITKTELYVSSVTLNTEDNNKLNQLLLKSESDSKEKFKRNVYWNDYKSKIETIIQTNNDNNYKITLLDTAIPVVNRLFVMEFNDNVVNPNATPIVDEDCKPYC